ncbi:hypothetical protein O181_035238 [Austropuccinia psidii MF-1]|uniref:Reverse transcriptase Ty1/copia-type domain-containing protein n=1 Tax=Austropuccinia psidii MF-1 TaxID=1389203 RepID=A0A9Q3D724_9BASI|nr:hypothetical protein [Austropuccinia psidii MF-1]
MILDKARCLLGSCNLPAEYWAEAINTAFLLSNLTPPKSRKNKTPHYLWISQEPRLKQLRTFSFLSFMAIPRHHCKWKLALAEEKGILLGYENNNTSYRTLGLNNNKVAITKHATFEKCSFPNVDQGLPLTNPMTDKNRQQFIMETSSAAMVDEPCELRNKQLKHNNLFLEGQCPTHLLGHSTSKISSPSRSSDRKLWQEAINKELEAMVNLKVWVVTKLEDDHKLIGTTWVFKTKESPLDDKKEYKACLCAQGFTQTTGIDYKKSYAPTGRLHSIRTLIAFAAANKPQFHQLDVKSTLLNVPLTENIYLSIPQGLNICRQSH